MGISSVKNNLRHRPSRVAVQRLIDAAGSAVFRPLRRPFPEVRRLLVTMIGPPADVFLASSILPHLRAAYPKAVIHFMTEAPSGVCLASNPYIDGVISCGRSAAKGTRSFPARTLADIASFFSVLRHMRKVSYDLVINLSAHPGFSIPASYLGRPRYMAGFSTAGCSFLLDKTVHSRQGSHVMERISDMLCALGIDTSLRALKPEFTSSRTAETECREMLMDLGLQDREPFVLIYTGTENPYGCWKKELWQEVVDKIGCEYGLRVVILDTVYGDIRGCVNLNVLVSLELFAAAAKMAELFVGTRQLHAHLAASFGTPAVLLRCGINDAAGTWLPGGSVSQVKKNLPCSPCFRKRGCSGMSCMEITSEECMREARVHLDSLRASKVVRLRR